MLPGFILEIQQPKHILYWKLIYFKLYKYNLILDVINTILKCYNFNVRLELIMLCLSKALLSPKLKNIFH